jgi:hypothetical protein
VQPEPESEKAPGQGRPIAKFDQLVQLKQQTFSISIETQVFFLLHPVIVNVGLLFAVAGGLSR